MMMVMTLLLCDISKAGIHTTVHTVWTLAIWMFLAVLNNFDVEVFSIHHDSFSVDSIDTICYYS